jgi:SH3 domain-containing protein
MNQLKVIPPSNVLPLRVAQVLKGEANRQREAKGNDYLSGATQPPLPLTRQRFELIKAYGKPQVRNAEKPTATQIAHPAAPRAPAPRDRHLSDRPPTPLRLALSSGIRTLVAGVVLVAALQIVTLGAIFWLGVINTPWSSAPALPSDKNTVPEIQSAIPAPVLSAPATLDASAGGNVLFPVALDGTDAVPARSIISISGLPQGSTFSSGRPYGATEWNFKTDEIGDLYLTVPNTANSESKLIIQLVAPNDGVLAATATILNVTPGPEAETAGLEPNIPVHAVKTQLIQGQAWDQSSHELNPMDVGQKSVNLQAPSEETAQLPTKHPAPTAKDALDAGWIRPSASVNLRKGPQSSAPIVGVVAKGAKLRVISRRRSWIQVANPATSQQGWIYAGLVDTIR